VRNASKSMARYFFDTSALVKHYHPEAGTGAVDRIINEPGAELLIARLTLVETISVFAIKVRTGEFDAAQFARLRGLFATHVTRRRYQVIRFLNIHYDHAQDLIKNHALSRQLRTLDALQLTVALHSHQTVPIDHFVCSDQRLCDVATLEGLAVINPELTP
jgi:predicted nucleic acid-binding protein